MTGTKANSATVKLKSEVIADVAIEALPATQSETPGFAIQCKGHKPGLNSGNLVVTTDLERPRELALPYACKVIGTLEVNPTNPFFNLKVSGSKSVYVLVRSSQRDFQVHSVYVAEGPFAADFERASDGDYFRIKVAVIDDQIDDDTRGVKPFCFDTGLGCRQSAASTNPAGVDIGEYANSPAHCSVLGTAQHLSVAFTR